MNSFLDFEIRRLVLSVKHAEMIGVRDEWLLSRHTRQLSDIEWHMRYAYDDQVTQDLIDRLKKKHVSCHI